VNIAALRSTTSKQTHCDSTTIAAVSVAAGIVIAVLSSVLTLCLYRHGRMQACVKVFCFDCCLPDDSHKQQATQHTHVHNKTKPVVY
jgi:hypothetical protein